MIAESRKHSASGPAISGLLRNDRATEHGKANRVDLVLVALLIAAATALYIHYALRIGSFQDDEETYLQSARYISHHFVWALWHNVVTNRQVPLFGRGIQRLDLFILALPFRWLRGPGAFEVAHVMQAILFASTALPVFLLGRRARIGRGASLFAATFVLVVPWAVVSTSFLAESAAYPAYAWVLYTTWMAAAAPSARRDALAVLTLGIAALSRTAMLALTPILPLTILWQEWRCGLAGTRLRARAGALPRQLWSSHRSLSVLCILLIVLFISAKLELVAVPFASKLTGSYGLPHLKALDSLLPRYRYYLSRIAAGTGFLPLVFAIPWVAATLVRPRDAGRHALAVVCILGFACVLLSVVGAGLDERYLLYAAVPVALTAALALSSWVRSDGIRTAISVGLLGSAIAMAIFIGSVRWPTSTNPYDFFTYPAATFYQRVVLGRISLIHMHSPLSPGRLVEIAIVAATAAWVVLAHRRRTIRPATILLGVGLLAVCATQLTYSLHKFTYGAGEGNGPNAAQRSWVDRQVTANASVGILALSLGETLSYQPVWRVADFWNTAIDASVYFNTPPPTGALPFPLSNKPVGVDIQPDSGLLYVPGEPNGDTGVPEYLLVSRQDTRSRGLKGETVGVDPALPLELIKLSKPARAIWSLAGTNAEGFMTSDQPATATVYSGALTGSDPQCASFSLVAPPGFLGHWPYVVYSGGHAVARGRLAATQTAKIVVPLYTRMKPHGPIATVAVRVHGQVTVNSAHLSATLAYFDVDSCARQTVRRVVATAQARN